MAINLSTSVHIDRPHVGRKRTLIVAVVVFFATRLYILFFLQPQLSDVSSRYFDLACRSVTQGGVPYQGKYSIEYPPLACWLVVLPRLFDSRTVDHPLSQEAAPVRRSYVQIFRGGMFFCDVISFLLFWLVVRRRKPFLLSWAMWLHVITGASLAHVLYDRLDIALLALLMLWTYCWLRSVETSNKTFVWGAVSGIALGLSISFKLIPVICVPFLALASWHASRRIARLCAELMPLTLAACLPFVLQYALSGAAVLTLFKFHRERGIQIESLYSSLMMLFSLFGGRLFVDHTFGSYETHGTLESAMKMLSTVMLIAFLIALAFQALWRGKRYNREMGYLFACFVMAIAPVFSKVLSPQYFVWIIPLIVLLSVELFASQRAALWTITGLLIIMVVATTWLFPYHYFAEDSGPHTLIPDDPSGSLLSSPAAYLVLGLRNAIYLGIAIWFGMKLLRAPADVCRSKSQAYSIVKD